MGWSFSTVYAAEAPVVGEVVFARGVATATWGNQAPRLIGNGVKIREGDRVDTGKRSFAILKLKDETKITLRPNTAMTIDELKTDKGEESALLSLVKGGMRAVTGFISKRRQNAFRVKSPTATIGIRGTDFDARICANDCATEEKIAEKKQQAREKDVIARAALVSGHVNVISSDRKKRRIFKNDPLYLGDNVFTEDTAFAVLVFRDDTRISVRSNTSFKVTDYQYKEDIDNDKQKKVAVKPDSAAFKLFRGGARVLTGLIGKRRPQGFRVSTPVSTIGIRGTGLDVNVSQGCASNPSSCEVYTHVWQGEVYMEMPSGTLSIRQGETLYMPKAGGEPVKLPEIPVFMLEEQTPRPDEPDVKLEDLFGQQGQDEIQPGLYVAVRDGQVALVQDGQVLEIGTNESGFVNEAGGQLLATIPDFITNDPYPVPDQFDPSVQQVLDLIEDEIQGLECSQ
jgi:hypothetical protein